MDRFRRASDCHVRGCHSRFKPVIAIVFAQPAIQSQDLSHEFVVTLEQNNGTEVARCVWENLPKQQQQQQQQHHQQQQQQQQEQQQQQQQQQ